MVGKLTRPQRLTLAYLEAHDRVGSGNPSLRHRIGMLRVMQERGLVSSNSHGQWSITKTGQTMLIDFYAPAGRAALEAKED